MALVRKKENREKRTKNTTMLSLMLNLLLDSKSRKQTASTKTNTEREIYVSTAWLGH